MTPQNTADSHAQPSRSFIPPRTPNGNGSEKKSSSTGVTMPFVHLHTHSEYSLLDGANRIPELLDRVQALGMDSLAITDHGNLHGAWSFYEEAKARKIRPILGFE